MRNRKGLCKRIKPGETGVIVGRHNKKTPLEEFKGYTDPSETEKKRIYNIVSMGDSGFLSGDLFQMDRYGYLFFKDRTGDTFRWKGMSLMDCNLFDGIIFMMVHILNDREIDKSS